MVLLERHTAHETDYCVLEIDEYGNEGGERMYLAHLRVLRWSPSTLRKIKSDWAVFRKAVTVPLFASPMHDDARWVKFVTMMGWHPFAHVLCQDGITRPLYIHTV
jgi:hypothetical protein